MTSPAGNAGPLSVTLRFEFLRRYSQAPNSCREAPKASNQLAWDPRGIFVAHDASAKTRTPSLQLAPNTHKPPFPLKPTSMEEQFERMMAQAQVGQRGRAEASVPDKFVPLPLRAGHAH